MTLTEAVKALRGLLNESQQAFATRLGISIRGLVNYEKDRQPPLALLLKLAAIARDAGDEKLADVFQWAFYEAITDATKGHQISFLQEDERAGENAGLLLMTFAQGQFEYVSAFSTAIKRMVDGGDAETRDKARKALDGLLSSIFPGVEPPKRATAKRGSK
jgi:transcriptional regulator with XRE-family HTH domain